MADIEQSAVKRKRRAFLSTEKTMILNMYHAMRNADSSASKGDILKAVASSLGVHWASVHRIVKEKNDSGELKSPKKLKQRLSIVDTIDNFTKCAIRNIVHNFFAQNEIPTLDKILKKISDDGTLGVIKRTTLHKILKKIGFKFCKRSRNSLLLDRDDIFFWRRNYLRAIKNARNNHQKIYYLDETWVNEGHTTSKAWVDTTVKSRRDAFINGLTTGLKTPSGKGKRLLITHIGSEDGFVEGGLNMFESKKQGDYHKEMNAEEFENWFREVLNMLDDNSVIVMDNASYHSRKIERIPTAKSKKQDICNWLREKNISCNAEMLKRELLNIVKNHRQRYDACIIDEMAKSQNKTVLRLPPYHCELNPIELVWAQVKGNVASHMKTHKMAELKIVLKESIQYIDAEKWKKCIKHVKEIVEPKMDAMDRNVEAMTERFIINVGNDSSDSTESDDDDDML
ncbi:uncharacterized protein LOC126053827 [Helicoverpa armigera]|uniref:uncharacterized protein LOC124629817 n=1 Tax=Helicoverpa zea TaxID=7113 RepID=UPI001F57825D|nr:uncharacterized protein LOC124629817 [Helicoverpa zea]XP_047041145.1 uncharacterized protein LOC124645387 [Helicoverpa zea]